MRCGHVHSQLYRGPDPVPETKTMTTGTKLTPEQREALLKIVRLRLQVWDAGAEAEKLFGQDVSTAGVKNDSLCARLDMVDDAGSLSDDDLIEGFFNNE
jgi:hypothetical protein